MAEVSIGADRTPTSYRFRDIFEWLGQILTRYRFGVDQHLVRFTGGLDRG